MSIVESSWPALPSTLRPSRTRSSARWTNGEGRSGRPSIGWTRCLVPGLMDRI